MAELGGGNLATDQRKSSVFFLNDLPKLAEFEGCIVRVPVAHYENRRNSKFRLFKKRKSEHTLYELGECTVLLLEYQYRFPGEVVHFTPEENQIPVLQLDLNRIEENTLRYVVQKSKIWQEFHLDDNGKKRSFVLQFKEGARFDDFNSQLQSVTQLLQNCKDNKLITNKKEKDLREDNRRRFSEAPCVSGYDIHHLGGDSSPPTSLSQEDIDPTVTSPSNQNNFIPPPFPPLLPVKGLQQTTCRVAGWEKVSLKGDKTEQSGSEESNETRQERYRKEIFGSLVEPARVESILKSDDQFVSIRDSNGQLVTVKLLYDNESNQNGRKVDNFEQTLNISEIDQNLEQSLNILEIDQNLEQSLNISKIDQEHDENEKEADNGLIFDGYSVENFLNLKGTIRKKTLKACDFEKTITKGQEEGNKVPEEKQTTQVPNFVISTDSDDEVVNNLNAMLARREVNELKQTAQLLQAAINEGDRENARQYAYIMAGSHVKVTVDVDESSLKADENEIKIKVFVEDKESSGGSLVLNVKPSDTIGDLKKNMFLRHNFPTEVQKWIVGKRIPKDEETLQKLKVTNGQTVFLYLVTAKSVGLEKKHHMAMATSGNYMKMEIGSVPFVAGTGMQPMNDLNSKPPTGPVEKPPRISNPPAPVVPVEVAPVQTTPAGRTDSKTMEGWQCLHCTYLNLPTRPGCEMCSNPRPKDYKIPEGYKMSQIESERLQKEKEDERKAREAAAERRARERELDANMYKQMTEEEIHQLLTLNDQMQQQIIQSRHGQEHEFHEPAQSTRGPAQPQEPLENIQFTLQPNAHLDFSRDTEDSD